MNDKEKQKLENYNARLKRQNEAIKDKYDRINAILPKGTKDRIKASGYSLNEFINMCVLERLEDIENN